MNNTQINNGLVAQAFIRCIELISEENSIKLAISTAAWMIKLNKEEKAKLSEIVISCYQ